MAPVIRGFLVDRDCITRAERSTAVTGNTVPGIYNDPVVLFPENAVRTVLDTTAAVHATLGVQIHFEPERDTADTHAITLPITGSPAFGILTSSIAGSILRIAASSLEM